MNSNIRDRSAKLKPSILVVAFAAAVGFNAVVVVDDDAVVDVVGMFVVAVAIAAVELGKNILARVGIKTGGK